MTPNFGNKFAIDADSGFITVEQSLSDDLSTSYTIRIQAVDLGAPSLTSTADVTLNIVQNNAPVVQPSSQETQLIDYNVAINTVVQTFTVTDSDQV